MFSKLFGRSSRVTFTADSIYLPYSNLDVAKTWWIETIGSREVDPIETDYPLESDVFLAFPADDRCSIMLSSLAEVAASDVTVGGDRPILFCKQIEAAHEHLASKGCAPGPVQDDRGPRHFGIRDPEGNVIEVCEDV